MKHLPIIFLFLLFSLTGNTLFAQSSPIPDSVMPIYRSAITTQAKMRALSKCFSNQLENDTVFSTKAIHLRTWLEKQNDLTGVTICNYFLANHAFMREQYAASLNSSLLVLRDAKEGNDTFLLKRVYDRICRAYEGAGNYELAAKYWKELVPIFRAEGNRQELAYTNNFVASNFASCFKGDSGLLYSQIAVKMADDLNNDTIRAFTLSTIAENYIALKQPDLAMPFLRRSLVCAFHTGLDSGNIGYIFNDFAQAFIGLEQYDSAVSYLNKAIVLTSLTNYKMQLLRTYDYLSAIFEKQGKEDSLNKYFRLATKLREEITGADKIKAIEAVNFAETLRQLESDAQKAKEEEEHKQNIQFAALGIGIISLLILFLLLSRTIIVKPRLVKLFGVIGLLITFEFLNLLLHPFLERITHHSPALMLLALAGLASVLVPLHHKLEHSITSKLVEKNEKIRLSVAKKIIETADKKSKEAHKE